VEAAVGAIKKLFTLTVIFLALPVAALAQDYVAAQGYLHSFNNGISVYSGVFALNKDVTLNTTGYFKYAVDLISPQGGEDDDDDEGEDEGGGDGSVRAVSGASAAVSAGSDVRHEIMAGITHNFNNIIGVEAYYDYSKENDYVSSTPTVTLKKDLFDKNTTLTLGYSRNMDTISGLFLSGEEDRTTDNYYAGLTQVLSPVTVAQIGYSHSNSEGLLSEGIRLVPTGTATAADCAPLMAPDPGIVAGGGCVNEAFPSERKRDAYIAGVNHYFTAGLGGLLDRSAVKLTFRYYDDSWDISSWMGEAEVYKYLVDNLVLRLNYRYYTQSQAFFVKDTYVASDQFKSSSPQLEEKDTNLVGLKLIYLLDPVSNWKLAVNALEGKYEYYTESIGVNAHIFMGGLRFTF
jgi:hypothetical protein